MADLTADTLEGLREYRDEQEAHATAQLEAYDRAVLTLASSFLGVSMAVIALIKRVDPTVELPVGWSVTAWVSLAGAAMLIVAGCLHTALRCRSHVQAANEVIDGAASYDDSTFAPRPLERQLTYLNVLAGGLLLVGLGALVAIMYAAVTTTAQP